MPTNMNAMTRYQILDELLSNKYGLRTMEELHEECERRLKELDPKAHVSKRQIEKDIKYLEWDGPFLAEIERVKVERTCGKDLRPITKKALRYANESFSIFKKKMSDEEKALIKGALDILGQLDGIPELDNLDSLKKGLGISEHEKVVDFGEFNVNGNIFGKLFMAAAHKQATEIVYHTFKEPDNHKSVIVHPYLLREYNKRWYVICGADDTGKILNFCLDRVDDVISKPELLFREPKEDLSERFDEIVGVSFFEENPCKEILFWVSDKSLNYVNTKKVHSTQFVYSEEFCTSIRKQFPELKGGRIFSIECRENVELYREFLSYGENLVVLDPETRKNMKEHIMNMFNNYKEKGE